MKAGDLPRHSTFYSYIRLILCTSIISDPNDMTKKGFEKYTHEEWQTVL